MGKSTVKLYCMNYIVVAKGLILSNMVFDLPSLRPRDDGENALFILSVTVGFGPLKT